MARQPEHALTIRKYVEFRSDVAKLAEGKYNALMILGNSGLGKTRAIQDALGEENCAVTSGSPSAWGFYKFCYDGINQTLILDDVAPKFFKDQHTNALLKALTETREDKTLYWTTAAAGEGKEYPSTFDTTSKVVIIANSWDSVSEHVRAIEGRVTTLIFEPSFMEVHRAVAEWFPPADQDVFDYIYEHRRVCTKPNMRLYVKALEQKKAGNPWQRRTLEMMIGDERMQQIAKLLTDPRYTSNLQRLKVFEAAGYGRSTTFYKLLSEFKNLLPEAQEEKIDLAAHQSEKK